MRWGRRREHEQEPADAVAHADDDRIVAHLEQRVGPLGPVWQELESDRVHVDVHVVPPGPGREFALLVTSGMSARPMAVPVGVARRAERQHAELCMVLPASWPLAVAGAHSTPDAADAWPIRVLREGARLPHEQGAWLGAGHAIVLAEPQGAFVAAVVAQPRRLGSAALVPGDPPISLLQLVPVTADELRIKDEQGVGRLLAGIDPARV